MPYQSASAALKDVRKNADQLSDLKFQWTGTTNFGERQLWVAYRLFGQNVKSGVITLPKFMDRKRRGVRFAKFLNRHLRMSKGRRITDHPNDRK